MLKQLCHCDTIVLMDVKIELNWLQNYYVTLLLTVFFVYAVSLPPIYSMLSAILYIADNILYIGGRGKGDKIEYVPNSHQTLESWSSGLFKYQNEEKEN